MSTPTVQILGVRIDPLTAKQVNDLILVHATAPYRKPLVIFKPYVEFLSLAAKNDDIKNLLNSSDLSVADSTAILWAASYLYGKPVMRFGVFSLLASLVFRVQSASWLGQIVPQKMAGVDQTKPLLQEADSLKLTIGILGGPRDTKQMQSALTKQFPGIEFHCWPGYFSARKESSIVDAISKCNLDILFCALGFPKQEKFISKYRSELKAKVIIGEGGSFDYSQLGGKIMRAPATLRKFGLEWLWRLLLQPKRFKRQLAIPYFIQTVHRQKRQRR